MLRVLCVIALATVAARAQEATLKVGSDAPPLTIAKWVKGDAVHLEKGRIHVVAFWTAGDVRSTACLPRLSELQDEYKDKATFVAVASDGDTLEAVEAMTKEMGPAMGYAVAFDDGAKTKAAWLAAAGVKGVTCAFVVDSNGKIAFFGHPFLIDFPLGRLAAGKWDAAKGPEEMQAAFRRAEAVVQMDRSVALASLAAFEKEYPELAWTRAVSGRGLMSLPTTKFRLLLLAGKSEEARTLGNALVERGVKFNDPFILNLVSWLIVDPEMELAERDLDLAMTAAEKAVELTKGEEGAILDTLARVYYWKGDLTKAIEIQTKAVEKDAGDETLQGALDEYKEKAAAKKE